MTHEYYMMQALKEAKRALEDDEIPIGAVVVVNEKIIARGHNMTERLNDPTAHAEMIALTSAFNSLGSKYLPDAVLYVTVEPCFMCAGAIYWSKLGKIIYGADPRLLEMNLSKLKEYPFSQVKIAKIVALTYM